MYNTMSPSIGGAGHSNPYFTYSQMYAPKRLKELFKVCEYLYYNSPHIFAALRKFGEYPITKITYDTNNSALKHQHQDLLEKIIRVKEFLTKATLDKYIYGNCFISMYQPFTRFLTCSSCKQRSNIKHTEYKFNATALTFSFTCTNCGARSVAGEKDVEDRKIMLPKDINFIRWDPKLMDIEHNPFTGESVYYYSIPSEYSQRIKRGQKHLIDTTPMGFLRAIKENKPFRFAPEALFHMKYGAPAGVNPQWGLPPILPALDRFFYTQTLRKANEAIAQEFLVPFRIVSPAPSSGNADPVQSINLSRWMENVKKNVQEWRNDPLHIMYAPVPLNVSQLNGQGRALLTLGEVQEAEKSLVATLGIPLEFLYGGLTGQGMGATLRMIENQLESHVSDLVNLLQWIDDSCSRFLGWQSVPVGMTPFRMMDDSEKKAQVAQLWQAGVQGIGPQMVSTTTMAELNELDPRKEHERIKEETIQEQRRKRETEIELQRLHNDMATQVQQQAGMQPEGYDQQRIIANADSIVQQLMQLDPATRRSHIHQLQVEDYVMYSVVIQRLEQEQTTAQQQARVQTGV